MTIIVYKKYCVPSFDKNIAINSEDTYLLKFSPTNIDESIFLCLEIHEANHLFISFFP